MGLEDKVGQYRSAEEGTMCFNCKYGHGHCQDALINALDGCKDFNMISKEDGERMETERLEKENRLDKLLNNYWRV